MYKSRKTFLTTFSLITALGFVLTLVAGTAQAAPSFADASLRQTWERSDKLLTERANAGRGFIYGPDVIFGGPENYADASDGKRYVQYFDKARLEINNAGADRNDPNFVSSGLLVKELVTGRQQNGNDVNNFTQGNPSEVQIAGDPNNSGGNPNSPTYRSFKNVATFNNDNPAESRVGSAVSQKLEKAGNVTSVTSPDSSIVIAGYESATRHNIANVFAQYSNSQGLIWNGSGYSNGPLFYPNATYVFGLPITDPYWIRATVAGVEKDVLVQLFERRVLTYTPSNQVDSRVEMGNVGQHYYRWRYQENLGGKSIPASGGNAAPANAPLPTQWLNRLNAYRAAAGLGPVSEDSSLSVDTAKHVQYMLLNPDDFRHDEYADRPGYTAEGQKAAKESNLYGGKGSYGDKNAIDAWLESAYHRYGMLRPELTRVGYALNCDATRCYAVLNVIAGMGGQSDPAGVVYPGNQQQQVKTGMITWQFGSFDPSVTVNSAVVKDAQGNQVAITVQPPEGYWNMIIIKPSKPLASNTTYTVEIQASQNGQALSKTWSFKTA